jgi:hypothetical protein
MTDPAKTDSGRKHTVIWKDEEWDKLERAAAALGEREHLGLAPLDIIRSGAIRRAEEILGETAA